MFDSSLSPVIKNQGIWKLRNGPDGIHLYDRRTGVNILIDEVIQPKSEWSSAPRHMSIALTNACDLNCPFCYAPKHQAQLDLNLLKGWLLELDQNGCLSVGFGGGEPTMFRHLSTICNFAAKNTKLAVTMTTHSHRIDEKLAHDLSGNVHFIRVSVDGVGTTYDRLRGKAFASLVQKLEIIRRIAPFGINVVINNETITELDELAMLAEQIQARKLLLLPEQPVHGRKGIDNCSLEKLKIWVLKHATIIPLRISQVGSDGMPICNPLPQEIGLKAYAHVDASGILRQSSFVPTGVPVGEAGIMMAHRKLCQECGETLQ